MSIKVSIIMPAYNAEKYLQQAIDSILSQTESNWELIVIDDGSKDGTAKILDNYAISDARIKVLHQENHGVAHSRQVGIDRAQGKYCIHVDADDWVEPDYLSSLLGKAEETQSDMVWCDCFCNENGIWRMSCPEDPDEMIRSILLQKHWGTLWNRLIKTSICQNRKVSFPLCSMWEDMAFVIQVLCLCKKIIYLPISLYHYRQIDSSLTHTQSGKDISSEYRKAISSIETCLQNNEMLDRYQYELRSIKLFAIRDFIDDLRFIDYGKFVNTYPDAIEHVWEYKSYPNRLKVCSWLIKRNFKCVVPFLCKADAVLRRMGITKQV